MFKSDNYTFSFDEVHDPIPCNEDGPDTTGRICMGCCKFIFGLRMTVVECTNSAKRYLFFCGTCIENDHLWEASKFREKLKLYKRKEILKKFTKQNE